MPNNWLGLHVGVPLRGKHNLYRANADRNGDCPVIVVGITPNCIADWTPADAVAAAALPAEATPLMMAHPKATLNDPTNKQLLAVRVLYYA